MDGRSGWQSGTGLECQHVYWWRVRLPSEFFLFPFYSFRMEPCLDAPLVTLYLDVVGQQLLYFAYPGLQFVVRDNGWRRFFVCRL